MNTVAFARVVRIDLRGRRLLGTVLFVGIVAVAAAALVTGAASRQSASDQWDAAFERAVAPHVVVNAEAPGVLAEVAAEPGVRLASDPVAFLNGFQLVLPDGREDVVVRAAAPGALPVVGAPYVVRGRLAATVGEVALEESFASELGIEVGDRVTLARAATTADATVVGTLLDFQDCFFPNCDPGVAWVTPDGLDSLGTTGRAYEVLLRLDDAGSAPTFAAALAQRYGDRVGGTQDWIDTRDDSLALNEFFGAFLGAFGMFVLIAVGVVVAGSVTNRVVARRRDIGLLKSVGVTPRQVVGAMTVEHLVLALVGVVAGWLASLLVLPNLRVGVADVLGSPDREWPFGSLLSALVAVGVIVALATNLPAWRAGRASAASALAPPARVAGRSRLARLAARSGGGPVTTTGLKDVFGRPLRSVLASLSVLLAVVALVITFGFDRTVDRSVGDTALIGDPWDVTLAPTGGATAVDLTSALGAVPSVDRWFTETEGRHLVDGQVVLVRAIGGDPAAAGYVIRAGAPLRSAGEAIAGFGLLDLLGKAIGDTVTVEIGDEQIPLTIVGRYSETEDSGEVLALRLETLTERFGTVDAGVVRVVARPGVEPSRLADDLRAAIGDQANAVPLDTDTGDFDAFAVAFWSVAALVLVVAIANLGATVLLGVRERSRELGTLRTVGFTPGQLVAASALGAAVLAGTAIAVGVPLGLWVERTLLRSVGEATGAGPELAAAPGALPLAVALAVVLAAAVGVAAAVSLQLARRSVSELVRYE